MAALSELIEPRAISLDEKVADWEAAVRAAGRLLEESGVAEESYTQAMVDSVHENGPYIVLAPGFAFAHARPSAAVRRTGMSWLRLAEPVEFGHKSNDPVSLVVALAATDSATHQGAMASLAGLIGDRDKKAALDAAATPDEVHRILQAGDGPQTRQSVETEQAERSRPRRATGTTHDHILTVCGNGLGTSLFLKNTLEKVLDAWGWGHLITVEATDTVSARGKVKSTDLVLTSGEIARALGDVGVPMRVIENFTSTAEIDRVLREMYDI
ncbi:PTS transporter subunit EIIA [Nocardioides sp. HDW12B]|uniref:PTS sugar transporter subunit IIA n=1 Tax=Nocardioides sp. HDW12B TaxID=2714939 RepID=UPI00140970FA|nr:PTS sugar transporter subunit IIA [Nocardioides sp. HDW12B]QIK65967.1 PTS transporter subunit EIIA [Nocardioides sp. HDW12B]